MRYTIFRPRCPSLRLIYYSLKQYSNRKLVNVFQPAELLVGVVEFDQKIAPYIVFKAPADGKLLFTVLCPEVHIPSPEGKIAVEDVIFPPETDAFRVVVRMHGVCDQKKLLILGRNRFIRKAD